MLITGATGLLGSNWIYFRAEHQKISALVHHRKIAHPLVTSIKLDLREPDLLSNFHTPHVDFIVHTAGFTSVEGCETYPDKAHVENTVMAKRVAEYAQAHKIKLVHISSDHLFAGNKPLSTEESTPSVLNEYAKTKLRAEEEIQKVCRDALVIRTNFYGWGHQYRQSFSDWIYSQLMQKNPITMYDNIYFTPIYTKHLIETIELLVEKGASGVFNVVGNDRISKYDFGVKLARQFNLDEALIHRGSYNSEGVRVKRPKDMSLDNSKASLLLKRNLGSIDDGLRALYEDREYNVSRAINEFISEQAQERN